ncbi:MAG TPA: response regulator [Sandaracinaceae bacterium LLY-WYZ-13_1]|nr:response regulator [Sandaracinaceae bacterium LLY-WYZ-13_1]
MSDERRRRGSILVIDDDPHLRGALARLLEHAGHEVREAADGPSAVEATKAHRPDLLLLDYMMPGMNGAMVLDVLRSELADETPPALLLTASGHHARAHEIGAVQGLEKPFNVPELLAAVGRYLDDTRRSAS